jgi:hypothetical protein
MGQGFIRKLTSHAGKKKGQFSGVFSSPKITKYFFG